jgi:hypothetical protein
MSIAKNIQNKSSCFYFNKKKSELHMRRIRIVCQTRRQKYISLLYLINILDKRLIFYLKGKG